MYHIMEKIARPVEAGLYVMGALGVESAARRRASPLGPEPIGEGSTAWYVVRDIVCSLYAVKVYCYICRCDKQVEEI
jgi:hypothetical protein